MFVKHTKDLSLVIGIFLIILGYYLLAVPSDALYEVVLFRVKAGILSVVAGGGLLAAWLTKR